MRALKPQMAVKAAAAKRRKIIAEALAISPRLVTEIAAITHTTTCQARTDLNRLVEDGLAHSYPDPSVQGKSGGGLSIRKLFAAGPGDEHDYDDRQRKTVKTWKFSAPAMFEPMAFLFGRAV